MLNVLLCVIIGVMPAMQLGCSDKNAVTNSVPGDQVNNQNEPNPGDSVITRPEIPGVALSIDWNSASTYSGDWSNYIVSEECYALFPWRNGSSPVSYNGLAMGGWDYVASDQWAFQQVSAYSGNTVGTVGTTTLAGTVPANATVGRGGWCKFFANLVLFRSSYGIGGGKHLVLPYGYDYANESVYNAKPGWVIQRGGSSPHTAIVIANLGWGLDVVDANYVGGNGKFLISRHPFSWAQLSGYGAYRATRMLRFY